MQKKPSHQAIAGFTLIELMIVVAIIAILAAIAIPSYLKYVQHGRRSDAMAALSLDQGILERCYATTFDYSKVKTTTAGCASLAATNNLSPQQYYDVALATAATSPAASYTLTATPVPGSPQASDSQCTAFVVTSANVKTANGTGGTTVATPACWQQ